MKRLAWLLRWRSPHIALWLGLALAAGSQAFTWIAVRPLEQRVASIQLERSAKPHADLVRIDVELERDSSPRAQLASFYGHFARGGAITDQLGKLYAVAKANGLEMQRADYRMGSSASARLERYQVVVPMQGNYAAIRAFVTAALRELPTMSLDNVQFQRKAIGDNVVEGQITVSFHLAR
jgi:hypothetical protein